MFKPAVRGRKKSLGLFLNKKFRLSDEERQPLSRGRLRMAAVPAKGQASYQSSFWLLAMPRILGPRTKAAFVKGNRPGGRPFRTMPVAQGLACIGTARLLAA